MNGSIFWNVSAICRMWRCPPHPGSHGTHFRPTGAHYVGLKGLPGHSHPDSSSEGLSSTANTSSGTVAIIHIVYKQHGSASRWRLFTSSSLYSAATDAVTVPWCSWFSYAVIFPVASFVFPTCMDSTSLLFEVQTPVKVSDSAGLKHVKHHRKNRNLSHLSIPRSIVASVRCTCKCQKRDEYCYVYCQLKRVIWQETRQAGRLETECITLQPRKIQGIVLHVVCRALFP